tara:strand:- start:1141 stop:1581 length:441 start_codon:yes stop_codon:yes gene_type:complete
MKGANSRHSYGEGSVLGRLLSYRNVSHVSIGLHPRFVCSIVHHAELIMGVPYRYNKEFMHPIEVGNHDGRPSVEPFYMNVTYRGCALVRDRNKKFFQKVVVRGAKLGSGDVYTYSLRDLVQQAVELLREDIYAWLDHPPDQRPWQE